jgi:hypothetical protein
MNRRLASEILDGLPPDDPRAMGSRRDLRRLNAWMGHHAILAGVLRPFMSSAAAGGLVDLGAGDGDFLLGVARRLGAGSHRIEAILLDRVDIVSPRVFEGLFSLGWPSRAVVSDVFEWLRRPEDGVPPWAYVTNLFLHHLAEDSLAVLFRLVQSRGGLFVAIEPRRNLWSMSFARCVGLIGCNGVTRHDAVASVRAGFSGPELSRLWGQVEGWRVRERRAGWFSHLFVAERVGVTE